MRRITIFSLLLSFFVMAGGAAAALVACDRCDRCDKKIINQFPDIALSIEACLGM